MIHKSLLCTLAVLALWTFSPNKVWSSTPIDSSAILSPKPIALVNSEILTARLLEIKAVDKSTLNFSEKRQLRKETRSIKNELRQINGGVYLSAGAIILIALLLIILL